MKMFELKSQNSNAPVNILKVSASITICLLIIGASGCSQQYLLERMVWKAEKEADAILKQDGLVSSYEFNRAIDNFENIIRKHPNSQYAINAKLRISDLYVVQKFYEKARAIHDELIEFHADNPELVAFILFKKGRSYESQGNWAQALKIFEIILNKYDETDECLSVPLYIAHYYVKNSDRRSAYQAYEAAAKFYQRIADKKPNSKRAIVAENLVVRTYLEQEEWDKAVSYIEELDKKYKLGPDTLLVLGKIHLNKLNDIKKAKEVYERMLKDYSEQENIIQAFKKELEKKE